MRPPRRFRRPSHAVSAASAAAALVAFLRTADARGAPAGGSAPAAAAGSALELLRAYEDAVGNLTTGRSLPLKGLSEQLLAFALWRAAGGGRERAAGVLDEASVADVAPVLGKAGDGPPHARFSRLARRALDLAAVLRSYRRGDSLVPALLALKPLGRAAAESPEVAATWESGAPPRLVLPHCGADLFRSALPWEGAAVGSARRWLPQVLARLDERTHFYISARVPVVFDAPCEAAASTPQLHDPTACLDELGDWDGAIMNIFLERPDDYIIEIRQSRIAPQSPAMEPHAGGLFHFRRSGPGGGVDVPVAMSHPRDGSAATGQFPETADFLSVSPEAGNCRLVQRLLGRRLKGANLPRVLLVPINPLLAPPVRSLPDFDQAFPALFEARDDPASFNMLLLSAHCSLQSAVDLLEPAFALVFVDFSLAVFVQARLAGRFRPEPGAAAAAAASPGLLWRRGAGCSWQLAPLLPAGGDASELETASWPCALLDSVPMEPGSARPECGGRAPPELAPQSLPGRSRLVGERGRCLRELGVCECFPPWRGLVCDRAEEQRVHFPEAREHAIVTCVGEEPQRLQELAWALRNWWERLNWRHDDPVVVFHDGLSEGSRASLRQASENRLWFARIRDFDVPEAALPRGTGELKHVPPGYRRMIRFKSGGLFSQPVLRRTHLILWLDTDSYFPGEVPVDPFAEVASAGARFGFVYMIHEPAFAVQGLLDVALLFKAAMDANGTRQPARPAFSTLFGDGSEDSALVRSAGLLGLSGELVGAFRGQTSWTRQVVMGDFEILDVHWWRSGLHQEFLDWMEEWGGWWLYRWGNHAIRTVQAWLFLEEGQALELEVPYAHQDFCQCGGAGGRCRRPEGPGSRFECRRT